MNFEQYYQMYVRNTLTGVVQLLSEEEDLKFVWAEISYFSRWWRDQDESTKNDLRRLVDTKRFQFVGGGWVREHSDVYLCSVLPHQFPYYLAMAC